MFFEDIPLHKRIKIDGVRIEKEKMIAFAQEYDPIPLHTDEEYAKASPFGGLIAPGVMSFMSVWAKYLEQDLIGDELIAGVSTKIEWKKPVYAGDVLEAEAEVTALTVRSERNGLVEICMRIWNQDGVEVMRNVTEAVVKRRGPANT